MNGLVKFGDLDEVPTLKIFDSRVEAEMSGALYSDMGIEHVRVCTDRDFGMKEGEYILDSRDGMLMDDGFFHFAMLFRNPRVGA